MNYETVMAHMLERGEIEEDNIFITGGGIQVPMNSGSDVPQLVSERIAILNKARVGYAVLAQTTGNSTLEFESRYRDLYEDIKEHHDVWFDRIFNIDNPNAIYTEWTCGLLGTLCTILRRRGNLDACMEVMEIYMSVLRRYQQMTEASDDRQTDECRGLTYKANLIRIMCGLELPDKQMTVKSFRDAIAYEQEEKALGTYDMEHGTDYDGQMEMFFGHNRFDEVSDDDIFTALGFLNGKDKPKDPQMQLRQCGFCETEESKYGDFKKCSKCHEMCYCSKQVTDWGFHKQLCGKKNNTNVLSECLVAVTTKIIKNYSEIVEHHTGHPVLEWNQRDAKLALVKQIKRMLTGDFQHFNSMQTMADADGDPAFFTVLANFFAKQPGYGEVWGKLSIGYRELAEKEREMDRQNNSLNVSEDHIVSCTTDLARTLTMQIGYLQSDENSSGMVDLGRSDRLVDELVPLVKRFMLKHPEKYNSHGGLVKLGDNEQFKVEMLDIVCSVMDIGDN